MTKYTRVGNVLLANNPGRRAGALTARTPVLESQGLIERADIHLNYRKTTSLNIDTTDPRACTSLKVVVAPLESRPDDGSSSGGTPLRFLAMGRRRLVWLSLTMMASVIALSAGVQSVQAATSPPISAGLPVCVAVAGSPGDFAVANATVVAPAGAGFATVHNSSADWLASSTNNFQAGWTIPNLTITKVGSDGRICMTSIATTHMILDVVGYIKASAITPVTTAGADRVLDTRALTGPTSGVKVLAGNAVCVAVAGSPGDFAVANATVVAPEEAGFATVHNSSADWLASSTNNFQAGWTIPNLTITKVGTDGKICMTSIATAHMILDVVGYIKAFAITPATTPGADRVLDTRQPAALPVGSDATSDPRAYCNERGLDLKFGNDINGDGVWVLGIEFDCQRLSRPRETDAGQRRCVTLAGSPGDYVIANATVVAPSGAGFATVHNSSADWLASSTNNFQAGWTIPNLTITKVGSDGRICMTSIATTHMILDVVGYIKASAINPVTTAGADRVLDTRVDSPLRGPCPIGQEVVPGSWHDLARDINGDGYDDAPDGIMQLNEVRCRAVA
jgi:hypothetical protein